MTFLVTVVAAYLVICLLAFLLQSRLIFFPDRNMVMTPSQEGMEFRDVFFDTEDGVRLHGWFLPARESRHVLLFFHGNAGNISHRLDSIEIFLRLGLSVFIIDYRGYGRSEGRISEQGTYTDARAARRYLTEEAGIAPENIVYFGRSLGGAVALELAAHHPPRALIVESTFTSSPELGERLYRWLPVRLLARIHYDSMSRLSQLDCPKIFVHSRDDEIVPFEMGRRLFESAPEPKAFLEISGDHNAGFVSSRAQYVAGLARFLADLD